MTKKLFAAFLITLPLNLFSQSFGFGDFNDSSFADNTSLGSGVKINGEINAELKGFFDEFDSAPDMRPGDIFSGKLDFSVSGAMADAVIKFNLVPVFDSWTMPISIDEAYLRAFFGPVNIEAGLRKLTWGRADSFGPLDVINPLDYSDLSALSDPQSIKISRPMLHLSWNINYTSKVEAVFVPWFSGHNFASAGRWAPGQITGLPNSFVEYGTVFYSMFGVTLSDIQKKGIYDGIEAYINANAINGFYPDTSTLKYAQAGLRFTTSIGPADLGFQYYFGRLPRPAFTIPASGFYVAPGPAPAFDPNQIKIDIAYNPYHQIGVDYAQVISGFNIRAEAGANITNDFDGTDGSVYNPALVWSLGFDRNLFLGINLNAQGSGSIRLFHDKIGDNPLLDTEAGTKLTQSRITVLLSRKFLRDELEIKAIGLWGIEDRDFLLMPGIYWSREGVSAELSAGFFLGDEKGELGQYRDNNYIKILLGYRF